MNVPTVLQLRQLCADIDALGLDKLHLGPIGGAFGHPPGPPVEPKPSYAGNTYVDIVEHHDQAIYRVSHVLPGPDPATAPPGVTFGEICCVVYASSPWSTHDLPPLATAVKFARGEYRYPKVGEVLQFELNGQRYETIANPGMFNEDATLLTVMARLPVWRVILALAGETP